MELSDWVKFLHPKVPRDIFEFAEQEILLPKGPRKGMHFDWDFAPFTRFIGEAIQDPRWRRVAVVGPTQNGKSLVATNIPMLYYLFEAQEDVIFGIPSMDLAGGMWADKIKPVILDCPKYRELLPTKGAGSRGGNFTAVQLKNGTSLRFMGAGGTAAQMSSHTAKVIIMSEIDKMDVAKGDGGEADPVSLIIDRADAFEDSVIVMECTVTTEDGRIWQEAMVHGSGGKVYVPCVKCGQYQELTRERLVFNKENQIVAEETARYSCVHCDAMWDNSDRLESLQYPLLVHKGQEVQNGKVIGEPPPTRTCGIHYNVLHSPLQSINKTAGQEWHAENSELKDVKKNMTQSKWAIPWVDEDLNRENLTEGRLRSLASNCPYELRDVPEWVEFLTFSVDMQKGYCYWMCEGYNRSTMQSIVIEYGTIDQRSDNDVGLHNMLSDADEITREGWEREDGVILHPEVRMVDLGGHWQAVVEDWLRDHRSWIGVKGIGQGQKNKLSHGKDVFAIEGIVRVRRQKNGFKIWFIEVDNTKAMVHDRYMLESDQLQGFRHVPLNVDISWIKSMTAEERVYDPYGESFKWVVKRRRNDYLDCASYNVASSYIIKQQHRKELANEQKQTEQRAEKLRKSPPRSQERNRGGFFSGQRRSFWGGDD